jgi:hypothetical protein
MGIQLIQDIGTIKGENGNMSPVDNQNKRERLNGSRVTKIE